MRSKILCFVFGLILVGLSCGRKAHKSGEIEVISSDLEKIESDGGKLVFSTNQAGVYIQNGDFMSTDFALSGNQSLKLDSTHVYGLNYKMINPEEGEFIQVSVWQKKGGNSGTLIASIKGVDYVNKYRTYYNSSAEGKNGWVQHHLSFVVTKDVEHIDFFVFSGKQETYFDDFKITRYPQSPDNGLKNELNLFIPDSSKKKIDGFIGNALKSEIIPSSDKKYVKSFIVNGNDSVKVKLKLKGDWTDHIKSGKTSYRIKISGNHSYNGLKTFSIQHPKTRNYLHEWVLHKMADIEDLLSTRYDFVSVNINGTNYGVYALEEHFDKQLLEQRNRREGPILKFDESGVWAMNYKAKEQGAGYVNFPYFDASVIKMFKQNRTLGSATLSQQFDEGKVLLNLFKNSHLKVEDIFDIDLLAKFYVLLELSSSNHGLAWHNRRFYYNPISQKLEHILYDVIPNRVKGDFSSYARHTLESGIRTKTLGFDFAVFMNREFKEKYLYYLEQKTRPAYLDSVFNLIDEELNLNLTAIWSEEPLYEFNKEEYYENAKFLRDSINVLDSVWTEKLENFGSKEEWIADENYFVRKDSFFVSEISLNAYTKKIDSQHYMVWAENYHLNDVEILGYSTKQFKKQIIRFEEGKTLEHYNKYADSVVFITKYQPKKLYFEAKNYPGHQLSVKVIPWQKPGEKTSRMRLENEFVATPTQYYRMNSDKVQFAGHVVIDRLLYIPSQYEVEIKAGSHIEFKNGGGLIVTNSFYALGTADKPILISCKDSSSMGVTVLKGQEAIIKHTNFKGLSNLNYGKWMLTGAVTIYETKTTIENVNIASNSSEDALNIIRSDFNITGLHVSETYSDGFDADFCTGILVNSSFTNTGNDCIDFSGSVIDIRDIDIVNSGDKGVSGGERSTLTLSNINIKGAITGIASKDDTQIKGKNITVEQVEVGYAAFQKKGEYAPATITLEECKTTQAEKNVLVELNSFITLNGEQFEGTEKLDIDTLYARFAKK